MNVSKIIKREEAYQEKNPRWGQIIQNSFDDPIFRSWIAFFKTKKVKHRITKGEDYKGGRGFKPTVCLELYQKWWVPRSFNFRCK